MRVTVLLRDEGYVSRKSRWDESKTKTTRWFCGPVLLGLSDWSRFAVKCGQHTSPLARFTRNFREYRVLVSPIGCDFPAYGLLAA